MRNIPRAVEVLGNDVWVSYGQYSVFYAPVQDRNGVSHLNKNTSSWKNFSFSELFNARSITDIAINPLDPKQVYLGSYSAGIVEIMDDQPVNLYNEKNTGAIDQPENRLEAIIDTEQVRNSKFIFRYLKYPLVHFFFNLRYRS